MEVVVLDAMGVIYTVGDAGHFLKARFGVVWMGSV